MSELLNILLLGVHLLATNVACAGPLICIWLGRSRVESPDERNFLSDQLGERLAWLSIVGLLIGIVLGSVQLWLTPTPGLLAAIGRLPNRALWFAALELLFSLVCLVAYFLTWAALRKHRWWHASLALLSSSNLLYHFPPLMSVLGKLAVNPRWAQAEVLDRAALRPLMIRTEILTLTTHYTLASVAVAAVLLLWLVSKSHASDSNDELQSVSRGAAWFAFVSTLAQLPVGVWLLLTLPQVEQTALLGRHLMASTAFAFALLLTLALLQKLLTIALGTVKPKELRGPGWMVALLVLLMTIALAGTRTRGRVPPRANSMDQEAAIEKPQSGNRSAALVVT